MRRNNRTSGSTTSASNSGTTGIHAAPHSENAAQPKQRSESPYQGRTAQRDNPTQAIIRQAVDFLIEQVKAGKVDWPAVQARLREQGIVLVGGGADEAPEVYKRLPDVLAAHADSIRVTHTLRPLGVAMAGRDVFDPYKD